jgi:PAS domain S-box-containing protein
MRGSGAEARPEGRGGFAAPAGWAAALLAALLVTAAALSNALSLPDRAGTTQGTSTVARRLETLVISGRDLQRGSPLRGAVRPAGTVPARPGSLRPVRADATGWPAALVLTLVAAVGAIAYLLRRGARTAVELAGLRALMSRRDAAEAERLLKEPVYRALYENTTDSIFVMRVAEDGRFLVEGRNKAHETDFGVGDLKGKELHDFMPRDQADYLTSFYKQCVESDAPLRYDVYFGSGRSGFFTAERGDSCWETVLTPVHDETGKITHVIGTSRDITDRIELEERLRQSQKMEALGQLTGGIAHDFNNLLTVIMGNLDLMKEAHEERKARLIDNAFQATERARDLTQKLLAFGRRQALKPEPTDLKALIAGMDDMLMQSLRGDIGLEFDLADDLWRVEVDQAQLQVALINLTANARDAMPKGGSLRIAAQNVSARDDREFEGVAISVVDTGHGMSRDVVARAFDPFFTTKEVGRGTGLGLAQVYGFAKQSGGSVEIWSELGSGTTVTLRLPRSEAAIAPPEAESPEPVERHATLRILLVEDNVQVAKVAAAILQEHGHDVTCAHSADEALAVLASDDGFELVFSDLVMPGGRDGLDLARAVRLRWPALPILLATGYSEAGARVAEEGLPLLAKPYRATNLVATVERVFAEGAARSAALGPPRGETDRPNGERPLSGLERRGPH